MENRPDQAPPRFRPAKKSPRRRGRGFLKSESGPAMRIDSTGGQARRRAGFLPASPAVTQPHQPHQAAAQQQQGGRKRGAMIENIAARNHGAGKRTGE